MRGPRAGLASLAVLLGGCVAGPLEGGRYACLIDGGADQCPDDWRCGFEGYCRQLGDVSKEWRCEADEHCESSWKCGLDESRDAGACHDPAKKFAYACFDDSHCSAGWHCGPEGRCYDRTVTTDHVCRADAGDCADNWRCGLNGRCQNQDAGAPYACATDAGLNDTWCEQGWRCAPEGVCLDPQADALGTGLRPVLDTAKIHPLGTGGPIERFVVSPRHETGPGAGRHTIAFVQGGQLQARLIDNRGSASVSRYLLGPWDGVSLAAMGSRGNYTNASNDLFSDEKTRIFVALRDAGVNILTLGSDGGHQREEAFTAFEATRLSMGSSIDPWAPRVMSFTDVPDLFHRLGGDRYTVYDGFFREEESRALFSNTVPNNKVVDVVSVRPSEFMECLFFVDRRGLWVAQKTFQRSGTVPSSYDFEAVELPRMNNDFCRPPAADAQRITRLAPYGRDWLGIASTNTDGGSAHVAIADLRPLWTRGDNDAFCTTFYGDPCLAYDRIPVESRMNPCPVCSGGILLDFAVVLDALGQPTVEARCGTTDGGAGGFFVLSRNSGSTGCERRIAEGPSGVFSKPALVSPDSPVSGQVAWASTDGFIWTGSASRNVISEFLDRTPTTVARRGPLPSDLLAYANEVTASFEPNIGFTATPGSIALIGVAHRPEWIVTPDRLLLNLAAGSSDSQLIGLVGETLNPFSAPYRATLAKAANATVVIVSAGTALFTAEMDAALSGQQPYASLSLKLVSPSQIDSLAFAQVPSASTYLRGYAVTSNGVLRLNAQTPSRWSFEEVPLPTRLVPKEVWFEDDRARVGFDDGTVYSLPSRVPIALPLAEGVVDYEQACGQQLALGVSGLYRLEPKTGSSVGEWKDLTLAPGFATPNAFVKGRIHAVGSSVYVFKRSGETARLTFDNCPSP